MGAIEFAIGTAVVVGGAIVVGKKLFPKRKNNPHRTIPMFGKEDISSPHDTMVTRKFNLYIIKNVFDEYGVDIHQGAALRVLLDTLEYKTYNRFIQHLYKNIGNISAFLSEWEKLERQELIINQVRTSSIDESIYVSEEEITLYLKNRNLVDGKDLLENISTLVNYSISVGYDKLIKQFGDRVEILKKDSSRLDVFNDIRDEMKMYMNFMS